MTLTVDEATRLHATWRPKFPDQAAYETSAQRYVDRIPLAKRSAAGLERWFREDVEGVNVVTALLGTLDPLAESHPQQDLDLTNTQFARAIAAGDVHDWSELEPVRHAAQCPRCQFAIHAREAANRRAVATGKQPFPGLGETLQRLAEDRRQRCETCGAWEDEVSPDTCTRGFWHLPDIYLALHPDHTLEDMGQLGPFMRGFLRRQRTP